MNQQRIVNCSKLKKEAPGLPFKPFQNEFGQKIYDNVSIEAWRMWITESPRYINTYKNLDLQSKEGKEFMETQMKIFFGFEEGDMADTAYTPTSE